jgi:uroporphyrinogen-III decarboxylase
MSTSSSPLTHRERFFNCLDRKPDSKPVWFPDLHYWLKVRRMTDDLPDGYSDLAEGNYQQALLALHRKPQIDAGLPWHVYGDFLKITYNKTEIVTQQESADTVKTEIRTPIGTLTSRERLGHAWESPFRVEYPVKTVEDFKIIEFMLADRKVEANFEAAEKLLAWVGSQGTVQLVLPRSPLPRIIHDYMGLATGIMALFDSPDQCQSLMKSIEEHDKTAFELIAQCPGRLTIFGDNLDNMSVSPDLYTQYSLPYYQRRCQLLHDAGKTVLCHMDGRLQGLLPLIKESGIDIWDGVTPEPMNDFTVEELAANLGEKQFAWAGVPSSMFCAGATREDIVNSAKKLIDLIGDKLLLNVGDQLPPDADISLLEAVTEIVNG